MKLSQSDKEYLAEAKNLAIDTLFEKESFFPDTEDFHQYVTDLITDSLKNRNTYLPLSKAPVKLKVDEQLTVAEILKYLSTVTSQAEVIRQYVIAFSKANKVTLNESQDRFIKLM